MLVLEGLGNVPFAAPTQLLQSDLDAGRAAGEDGLARLLGPFLHVVGSVWVLVAFLQGVGDVGDGEAGLETVVDGDTDVCGDLLGYVVRYAGGEFFDCVVDDVQALGQPLGVFEVELGQAGFEVGEGAAVDVVGCDAGQAATMLA